MTNFPNESRPTAPAKVSEFAAYLQQRWRQGCHNASRLYQEIRQQGYRGKRSMVARFVAAWRKTDKATSTKAAERISPRHAAILVTRPADQINDEQQQLLHRLALQCPAIIDLRKIALGFRAALVADDSNQLRGWIDGARHSEFGPVMRFAYGLQRDLSAVAAAVDSSWSTGQIEGQINRLKTIKRQMYGRAGFELLHARGCRTHRQPPPDRRRELHQNCGRTAAWLTLIFRFGPPLMFFDRSQFQTLKVIHFKDR